MKIARKWSKRILVSLLILLIVSIAGCYFAAILLTTPFRFITRNYPSEINLENYQRVQFRTSDNLLLSAWYVPPSREDGASILFVHGLSGNKAQFLPEAELFDEMGYGILLLELRAHGYSEGDMIGMSQWETRDVVAAFDFLIQQEGVNPKRIALYGQSLGAATAIHSAPLVDSRVLLLDAPFADMREAIRGTLANYYHVPPLFFPELVLYFASSRSGLDYDAVRPLDIMDSIDVPVFLMYGTNDERVPLEQAYWLYEAANEPKLLYIVEGAGHEFSYETDPEGYKATLFPFLEQYLLND